MIFEVNIGDWSKDGHNQSKRFLFQTSATREEIKKAYDKGVKILGVDITKYCSDYEDSSLPTEQYDTYIESGWGGLEDGFETDEDVHLYITDYLSLWLHTIKIGCDTISIEEINSETSFNIGGYGLFY
jgi:hypothetical protein